LLGLWSAIVTFTGVLALFAGAGYAFLAIGLPLGAATFFATSRSRWSVLQQLAKGRAVESSWSPLLAILLLTSSAIWTLFTVVLLFIVGNPTILR
jgi:hypothetical protein